jgi:hypothetical protein
VAGPPDHGILGSVRKRSRTTRANHSRRRTAGIGPAAGPLTETRTIREIPPVPNSRGQWARLRSPARLRHCKRVAGSARRALQGGPSRTMPNPRGRARRSPLSAGTGGVPRDGPARRAPPPWQRRPLSKGIAGEILYIYKIPHVHIYKIPPSTVQGNRGARPSCARARSVRGSVRVRCRPSQMSPGPPTPHPPASPPLRVQSS